MEISEDDEKMIYFGLKTMSEGDTSSSIHESLKVIRNIRIIKQIIS
jgi:hypothetical protein